MNTLHYDLALLIGKESSAEQVHLLLADARDFLRALGEADFTRHNLDQGLRAVAGKRGIDPAWLFRPLRVALQGNMGQPDLYETMLALRRDRTLKLVEEAIRSLGSMANTT